MIKNTETKCFQMKSARVEKENTLTLLPTKSVEKRGKISSREGRHLLLVEWEYKVV